MLTEWPLTVTWFMIIFRWYSKFVGAFCVGGCCWLGAVVIWNFTSKHSKCSFERRFSLRVYLSGNSKFALTTIASFIWISHTKLFLISLKGVSRGKNLSSSFFIHLARTIDSGAKRESHSTQIQNKTVLFI